MTAPASILERGAQLQALQTALQRAAEGSGSVVLVYGEAGIGKTTLIDAFEAQSSVPGSLFLRGACDALRTPRPLGPLLDMGRAAGGRLRAIVEGEPKRERLFGGFLDLLQRQRPTALVIEDVHWADLATLDFLTILGRRTRETAALVIITFRDDEISVDHPLREVLATLPRDAVVRLPLPRLSGAAVEQLALRAGRTVGNLFALTHGNPFYVTEVLAGGVASDDSPPPSVQDAVFARAARLTPAAVDILDTVALSPGHMERWLLDMVADPRATDVRECTDSGVLLAEKGRLSFRHEIARQAWRERVDAARARHLHARLLSALEATAPGDAAQLVHHAAGAGDDAAVLRLAPLAAEQAEQLGAHREAAAHYEAALAVAAELGPDERAELLEALGRESYLIGRTERAVVVLEEALALRRRLGDRKMQSENERWLGRVAWFRGDDDRVRHHVDAAIDVAEPLGPSAELARAYSMRSQVLMCAEETRPAVEWGERALEMARLVDDLDTLAHSHINVGCALLMAGDPAGRGWLEQARELARENGLHDAEARTLVNDAEIAVDWRDVERAEKALSTAIDYCVQRDMDPYALCAMGARASWRLWRGEWSAAAEDATAVLAHPRVPPVDRIPALAVLGLLRARRGDPDPWTLLDEAARLAAPTREPHRVAPVAAARAEAAWLEGRLEDLVGEIGTAYAMAVERDNPWVTGELAFWLEEAGALEQAPAGPAAPYLQQMAGDPAAAAASWARLGFPFEQALALVQCDDPAAAREGLRILRALGASRVAEKVAGDLREQGVKHLPRGPRTPTRLNPAGLTRRQLQVLRLLGQGHSNQTIARRLHISTKTVEHHVTAVLSKLRVHSRTEAALRADELTVDEPPSSAT